MRDDPSAFDLTDFLPYLLNQAAEATSRAFAPTYRDGHGMTRTQWRVMAHLGGFGAMTARDICRRSQIEKTKVSRAVAALEARGHLRRDPAPGDRRAEMLSLTGAGLALFGILGQAANDHDAALRARLGPDRAALLQDTLRMLIAEGLSDGEDA